MQPWKYSKAVKILTGSEAREREAEGGPKHDKWAGPGRDSGMISEKEKKNERNKPKKAVKKEKPSLEWPE